jgi:hypothetical protein
MIWFDNWFHGKWRGHISAITSAGYKLFTEKSLNDLIFSQEILSCRAADRTEDEMTAQQKIEEEVFKQIFIPRQLDQVRTSFCTARDLFGRFRTWPLFH